MIKGDIVFIRFPFTDLSQIKLRHIPSVKAMEEHKENF